MRTQPLGANWLEPVVAAVLLALLLAFDGNSGIVPMVLSLTVCLAAGLSAPFPRAGAALSMLGLVGFWFVSPTAVNTSTMAVYINVFALARRRGPGTTWLTAALLAVGYSVMVVHAFDSPGAWATASISFFALTALAIGAGSLWNRSVQRIAQVKEEASEQVAALRVSLARDLHDTVAQTLSNAAMRAHMAGLDPDLTPELRGALEDIAADCGNAAQDLRKLLSTLRDLDETVSTQTGPLADAESLKRTVAEQVNRLKQAGFFVRHDVQISAPISPARADAVSKVTVEAVNNMIKHALPAGECRILLRADRNSLSAEYWNQTMGRRRTVKGLGLIGIHERMHLLDGTCSVEERDGWWMNEIFLPLHNEALTTVNDTPRAAPAGHTSSIEPSTFGDNPADTFAKPGSDAVE